VLEVNVVDVSSGGMLEDAEQLRGSEAQLVEMQNQAAIAVLKALKIDLSEKEVERLVGNRTNDQLEGYKLLTESMGVAEESDTPTAPPSEPRSPHASWRFDWPSPAFAGDDAERTAVQQLLERYRTALESKNVDRIAAVYVEMTPGVRDALARYFATADDLKVRFSDYDILIEGNEAVATFTRNDQFRDTNSGHDMQLEVRVSSMVAKQDGGWRIRGLRRRS
jgi:ketosteroid isomerase-like protein